MNYLCTFCGKELSSGKSLFSYIQKICKPCNTDYFFHRHSFYSDDFILYEIIIRTHINNIEYSVNILDDTTVIRDCFCFEKVINKRLPITPSNINSKIQMYLALI